MIRAGAIGLAVLAGPAAAQMQPASATEIGAATSDCIKAAKGDGFDTGSLMAAGWRAATAQKDGKSTPSPVSIYGKSANHALITTGLASSKAPGLCAVMASLLSYAQYGAVAAAISSATGTAPFNKEGNAVRWRAGALILQLEPTGASEKPSVRIAMAPVMEKK